MKERVINAECLSAFSDVLHTTERSEGTIENYLRHVRSFALWLGGKKVTREMAAEWKRHLQEQGYATATINAMLAAVNGLFRVLGWEDCRVKFLKVQRRAFREPRRGDAQG